MTLPRIPIRPTIRLRLTLLFGGLFFLAGAFLLILTYALVGQAQPAPNRSFEEAIARGELPPAFLDASGEGFDRPSPATSGERLQEAQTIFQERERAREEWLRSIRTQSGIALVLTSFGALALGWIVAGRVLRPVRQITLHAKELSSATLNNRIDLAGPNDEVKELADTIDAMLGRLEAAFQSQRHFSAQASHELRTPLSIIRAEADVALANPKASADGTELASRVRAAVDRCDGLIDGLLALARSESTMRDYDSIDLAELTGDVVGEYLGQAREFNVRIDLLLDYAPVTADKALLERLVGNLLDNAIRYNTAGGWVLVAVNEVESQARLVIENSGPRMDSDEATRLLAPFQRGERSQSPGLGYGLGLAIVRAVARAHGGGVGVQPRGEGGLTVRVSLPAADAGQEEPPAETGQTSSPGAPREAYGLDSPL